MNLGVRLAMPERERDGFDDLLLEPCGRRVGQRQLGRGGQLLVFGGSSLPTTIDLANLGTAGITFFGVDSGDTSGHSVSRAGDVMGMVSTTCSLERRTATGRATPNRIPVRVI